MSSNRYDAALHIKPTFSISLAIFIVLLHTLAGITILFLLNIPILQQSLLLLIVSIFGYYIYRLHCLRIASASIIALSLSHNNQWQITLASAPKHPYSAILLANSILTYSLMILSFKTECGKHYSIVLPKDALDFQLARQIRARIRVGV